MTRNGGTRAPSLERLLRERSREELAELYSFWNGREPAPKASDDLVVALMARMTDEESVRKRIKFLSKKLVELVKFLLRDRAFSARYEAVKSSRLFNYMSPYEVEAALNALQKRGFVFPVAPRGDEARYAIPAELGAALQTFLWEDDAPLEELFSMRGWIRRRGEAMFERLSALLDGEGAAPSSLEDLAARLCQPAEVARRIEGLEDDVREVLRTAIEQGGGFLSRSQYGRLRKKATRWNRRRFKEALENACLGTVRHISLGEYGVNHFDDTLVLFHETVAAYRQRLAGDPARDVERYLTCGVDLISDIAHFLSFVAHHRVRLTLNGQIYRTVAKKLAAQLILASKEDLKRIDPFHYVYDFCVARKLVEKRPDRTLRITVKGRRWERERLERKLKVLLDYAFRERLQDGDGFHAPLLRRRLLDLLATQQVGVAVDAMALPFGARNAYLSRLEEDRVRDAFQNRYQYTPTTVMKDAPGLAQSLFQWLRDRLYLLGIVDLGVQGDVVRVVRLTPLGARALGREVAPDVAGQGRPLIVNPDFEILLYPDAGETYDLITQLDRFALRTSSDSVYRYKVTAATIEKAVAEGGDVAEILRTLSENARGAIPQNVVYSIKEWAQAVRFVRVRPMLLLRGRNREVMDRVMRGLQARGIAAERLSPTAVALDANADLAQAKEDLEKDGVFLEDATPEPSGDGDGD